MNAHEKINVMLNGLDRKIKWLYSEQADYISGSLMLYLSTLEVDIIRLKRELESGSLTQQRFATILSLTINNSRELDDICREIAEAIAESSEIVFNDVKRVCEDAHRLAYLEEAREARKENSGNIAMIAALSAVIVPRNTDSLSKRKEAKYHVQNLKNGILSNSLLYAAPSSAALLPQSISWQGDKMEQWARRYMNSVSKNTADSVVKKAVHSMKAISRTKATKWENRARQGVYNVMERFGVGVEKVWHTQLDDRVRDAHADMEGMTVKANEPFICQGYEMDYPGDDSGGAPASLVYNCRCYMKRA